MPDAVRARCGYSPEEAHFQTNVNLPATPRGNHWGTVLSCILHPVSSPRLCQNLNLPNAAHGIFTLPRFLYCIGIGVQYTHHFPVHGIFGKQCNP